MDKKIKKDAETLTPFQDSVDVRLFFSGAQRRKLLEEVKKAIAEEVSVISITGDEGSGKTMICKMLEKELPSDYVCVYLPNTLESFDDVIRVLALGLATENSDKPESTKVLVLEIIKDLEENNRTLVAIFDQAERMYLATIERIRKMLDLVNKKETLLQVIFAGRKSFSESFAQLSICDFVKTEERHFSLNTLGLSETYAYLNYSAQQRSTGRAKNVFTPEAAKKIYSMAQGNLRMTNILAAKSLEASDSDTSFMVLLDNVGDKDTTKSARRKGLRMMQPVSGIKGWLVVGAGAVAVVVLILSFFNGHQDENGDLAVVETPKVEKPVTAVEQKPADPQPAKKVEEKPQQIVQKIVPAPEKTIPENIGKETPVVSETEVTKKKAAEEKITAIQAVPDVAVEPVVAPELKVAAEVESSIVGVNPIDDSVAKEPAVEEPGEDVNTVMAETEKEQIAAVAESEDRRADVQPAAEQAAPEVFVITANKKKKKNEIPEPISAVTELAAESAPQLSAVETDTASGNDRERSVETEKRQISVAPLKIEETNVAAVGVVAEEALKALSVQEERRQTEAADTLSVEPLIIAEIRKRMPLPQTEFDGLKKPVRVAPVKIGVMTPEEAQATEDAAVDDSADDLYRQRIAAGEKWLTLEENENHTIQLMVLTADSAEENLKQRLEQNEYKEIAEELYIIKNGESKVFVFFGDYPDSETARQARNTLPVFLREHDPYPLPVEEAVTKATSQE